MCHTSKRKMGTAICFHTFIMELLTAIRYLIKFCTQIFKEWKFKVIFLVAFLHTLNYFFYSPAVQRVINAEKNKWEKFKILPIWTEINPVKYLNIDLVWKVEIIRIGKKFRIYRIIPMLVYIWTVWMHAKHNFAL